MLVDGQCVREQQHILMHEGESVPDGYRLCKSPGRPNLEKISMWNQLDNGDLGGPRDSGN